MLELNTKHKPIDLITLSDLLEEKKLLDKLGGVAALGEFATEVPSASHIFEYAQIIKKKTPTVMIRPAQSFSVIADHSV